MAKSFLERVQPSRQRWKMVEWPFPVEGDERPKVKVRVLGQDDAEGAFLATVDHFKGRKPEVKFTDPAFVGREHIELVWRAYSVDGEPLAEDADEMAKQPIGVINELYSTWVQFQNDVTAPPATAAEMDALIELLKKNMDPGQLKGFCSTWLIELITTLASRLPPSTPVNEHG